MKAIIADKYGTGDSLKLVEIDRPSPGKDQLLVETYAASVNPFDVKLLSGIFKTMIPVTFPYIPGGDIAGVVSEVGAAVSGFRPGDKIFGSANILSGGGGAFAEYTLVKSQNCALIPQSADFIRAAGAVLAGASALQALETHIKLDHGQKILILGGAGGIGHIAVQIAKALGAEVTATVSAGDIDFVKKIGADVAYDYKKVTPDRLARDFDAVFITAGGGVAVNSLVGVLKKGGTLVSMLGPFDETAAKAAGINVFSQNTRVVTSGLNRLREYIDSGKVHIHVDQVFAFVETGNAFDYQSSGSVRGKAAVKVKS